MHLHIGERPGPPEKGQMARTPRERSLQDVIAELRAKHGEAAPGYFKLWTAHANGRLTSHKRGGAIMVSNTLAELERIFGLVTPPVPKPKRPRSSQPTRPTAA
jgi:hypothetical protein